MKIVNQKTFNRIRALSLNDFNRWLAQFYANAFSDGQGALLEMAAMNKDSVKRVATACLTDDELLKAVRSVPGIGEKRARLVLDAVHKAGGA